MTDWADVYFAEQANSACGHETASVRRCGVSGCGDAPETLAAGLQVPSAIAIFMSFVFVADSAAGAVWRLSAPVPPLR